MSDDKVKTLNQVVEEFYKDGEEEVANFKTRLATARDRQIGRASCRERV